MVCSGCSETVSIFFIYFALLKCQDLILFIFSSAASAQALHCSLPEPGFLTATA